MRARIDSFVAIARTSFTLRNLAAADSSVREAANRNVQGLHPPTHFALDSVLFDDADLNQCRGGTVPLIARARSSDAIDIAIRPYCDHGSIILIGRIVGDSIVGTWVVTGYVNNPTGSFTMRRP
jgi:hypothetical protein